MMPHPDHAQIDRKDDDPIWAETLRRLFELEHSPDDQALRRALHDWLAADPRHAQAWAQAQTIWTAIPKLPPQAMRERTRMARRRFLIGGSAMAAGLALTLSGRDRLTRIWADHSTRVGERRAVDLADGTRLQLNTDSAVRTHFDDTSRHVTLLRGEIFVSVPPNSTALQIKVADSLFKIDWGQANLRDAAALRRISLEQGDAALIRQGESIALAPGTEAVWEPGAERWLLGRAGDSSTWKSGRLVVEEWSVAQVLRELNRYHPGTIVLADTALGQKTINGIYDLNRPDNAVRAVASAFDAPVRDFGAYVLVVGSVSL